MYGGLRTLTQMKGLRTFTQVGWGGLRTLTQEGGFSATDGSVPLMVVLLVRPPTTGTRRARPNRPPGAPEPSDRSDDLPPSTAASGF